MASATVRGQRDHQRVMVGIFGGRPSYLGRPPYLMHLSCANVALQAAEPVLLATAGAGARILIAIDRPSAAGLLAVGAFPTEEAGCGAEEQGLTCSRPFRGSQGSLRGGTQGLHRAPEIVAAWAARARHPQGGISQTCSGVAGTRPAALLTGGFVLMLVPRPAAEAPQRALRYLLKYTQLRNMLPNEQATSLFC